MRFRNLLWSYGWKFCIITIGKKYYIWGLLAQVKKSMRSRAKGLTSDFCRDRSCIHLHIIQTICSLSWTKAALGERLNHWRGGNQTRKEANNDSTIVCAWFHLHGVVSRINKWLVLEGPANKSSSSNIGIGVLWFEPLEAIRAASGCISWNWGTPMVHILWVFIPIPN